MQKLLTLVLISGLAIYASPAMAFDPSEYRQNTYGPPNHYCDPARSLASAGSGTLADPWNMSQCATQPVAGDVVGILPGISVRLPTTNSSRIPAFNPSNSGTATRRIIYVTKHAAVALAGVETNPLRTELRHDGGAPYITASGVGAGNGAPMYGAYGRNYITFDGFYVDMAQAYMREDSGVIRPENSRGIHFRNFVIKGATLTVASNAVMYRPHNAVDTVLSNFRAYDFINNPTGSATPQAALFSDQYGDQNFLIEHFEIRNTQRGIFLKGTTPGPVFNSGTIRYGIVSDVSSCYQFNDLDPASITTVQYSLCYNTAQGGGVVMSSETSPARNLIIDHVTVAKVDAASINTEGGIITRNNGIASNVTITNNLVDNNSGTFGHQVSLRSTLPTAMSNNAYYKNGGAESYVFNGAQYNAFSSWVAAISGRDANSQELPSSPFVDRANNNFRITAGHALKTASTTGGEIGAYGGSEPVGVDISGSSSSDQTPPSIPTGLQIR